MNIMNLTPHDVMFVDDNENVIRTIRPSGIPARVSARTVIVGEIDGIPVTKTEFGEIENLPDPEEGTIYIVSLAVAKSCPDRDDVFIPNESVRNEKGVIIGCKSFGIVA